MQELGVFTRAAYKSQMAEWTRRQARKLAKQEAASSTFTCDQCGGTFPFEWSDEKAREEARANGFDPDAPDMAILCDDCYKAVMAQRAEID